jgi:hypothetical protein
MKIREVIEQLKKEPIKRIPLGIPHFRGDQAKITILAPNGKPHAIEYIPVEFTIDESNDEQKTCICFGPPVDNCPIHGVKNEIT